MIANYVIVSFDWKIKQFLYKLASKLSNSREQNVVCINFNSNFELDINLQTSNIHIINIKQTEMIDFHSILNPLHFITGINNIFIDLAYTDIVAFQLLSDKVIDGIYNYISFCTKFIHVIKDKCISPSQIILFGSLIGKTNTSPAPGTFIASTFNHTIEALAHSLHNDFEQSNIHVTSLFCTKISNGEMDKDISFGSVYFLPAKSFIQLNDLYAAIKFIGSMARRNCTIKNLVLQTYEQPNCNTKLAQEVANTNAQDGNIKTQSYLHNEKKNPVAIVTGASQGIGKAVALRLAKLGFDLALISRSIESLNKVKEECTSYGSKVECFPTDIQALDTLKDMFQNILQSFGKINVIFCNAGVNRRRNMIRADQDILDSVIKTNYTAHCHLVKLCIPVLANIPSSEPRSIMFNGSNNVSNVMFGGAGTSQYVASKFALLGLSNSLFEELRENRINVTYLFIGLVNTELGTKKSPFEVIDGDEMIQTEDIADLVDYNLTTKSCCPTHVFIHPRRSNRPNQHRLLDELLNQKETMLNI